MAFGISLALPYVSTSSDMCECLPVCMYVQTDIMRGTCMPYTYIHIPIVYKCIYKDIYMYMYAEIHIYIHIYTCIYIYVYLYLQIYIYMYIGI